MRSTRRWMIAGGAVLVILALAYAPSPWSEDEPQCAAECRNGAVVFCRMNVMVAIVQPDGIHDLNVRERGVHDAEKRRQNRVGPEATGQEAEKFVAAGCEAAHP